MTLKIALRKSWERQMSLQPKSQPCVQPLSPRRVSSSTLGTQYRGLGWKAGSRFSTSVRSRNSARFSEYVAHRQSKLARGRPARPSPRRVPRSIRESLESQPLSGLVLRRRTGANVFCVAIFNIRVDRPETRFELSRDRFAPARYGAVTALVLRREGGDARALLPAQSTGWP
jgi:hypothetical protein